MSRVILAFGCKRLRGKDTAAKITCEILKQKEIPSHYDAFAASLKEMCRVVFGFNVHQLYGAEKDIIDPYWGFTPRWAMQRVGSAMREMVDKDIWVKTVLKRIHDWPDVSFLVSDLRFPNEAKAIKDLGGYLIKVDRNIPFNPLADTHESEMALDNFEEWNYHIENNGSMDELQSQVTHIVDDILIKGDLNDKNTSSTS